MEFILNNKLSIFNFEEQEINLLITFHSLTPKGKKELIKYSIPCISISVKTNRYQFT
jgi:hypothetical protein